MERREGGRGGREGRGGRGGTEGDSYLEHILSLYPASHEKSDVPADEKH